MPLTQESASDAFWDAVASCTTLDDLMSRFRVSEGQTVNGKTAWWLNNTEPAWTCVDCGHVVCATPATGVPPEVREPCPNCGFSERDTDPGFEISWA